MTQSWSACACVLSFPVSLPATSGTLVALRGAASAQNISFRPPKAGPGTHIASSVRDIRSSSILQQDRAGGQDFVVSPAPPVTRMKRFSASTGHLLKSAKTGTEDGNILDDQLSSDDSKLEADIGKANNAWLEGPNEPNC